MNLLLHILNIIGLRIVSVEIYITPNNGSGCSACKSVAVVQKLAMYREIFFKMGDRASK